MTAQPVRPERSLLSVPASSERFFAKAAASAADTIMLDLEDSVAPDQKDAARLRTVEVVNAMDWGSKTLLVRVNGLDTQWAYKDLVTIAEACPRLDGVMVPKIDAARDVHFVETLLQQVERSVSRKRPIGIEILVESAKGMMNVDEIAGASPRLEAIHFGPGDYAASIGNRAKVIGGPDPSYAVLTDADGNGNRQRHWGDVWHYALSRIAVACRAHDLRPIDGVYVDFNDPDGYKAAARRSLALGIEGKWCIHPSQIALANEVYSPTPDEIAWAKKLLSVMDEAHHSGAGAVQIKGQMIDMAHVRQAERVMAKATRMGLTS